LDSLTDVTLTTPTTGEVLKYDGTEWVNGADSTGKVLRILHTTDSTSRSTTSTTFQNGQLTITLTPLSATSKFIVSVNTSVDNSRGGTGDSQSGYAIFRDSTNLKETVYGHLASTTATGDRRTYGPITMTVLDAPATTGSITYQWRFRSSIDTSTTAFTQSTRSTARLGEMIVMEVEA
jgi:hypothetical protein